MVHRVFVYGTLKKGHKLHPFLQGQRGYSAIALNIALHAGPHYPFAVRGKGRAVGEVYEIDELLLHELDQLEGHPTDYHRELTPVMLDDGSMLDAWIYLNSKKARHYPLIKNGKWSILL